MRERGDKITRNLFLNALKEEVKVKVISRPTVSRRVYFGVRLASGTLYKFFSFLSLIIFRQLRFCWCGAPSLTRGRVCSFQLLLGFASGVFLRSEPQRLLNFFLNCIWIFSSYFTESAQLVHHRAQPLHFDYGNNRYTFWALWEIHKYAVWAKCGVSCFNVEADDTGRNAPSGPHKLPLFQTLYWDKSLFALHYPTIDFSHALSLKSGGLWFS
jgi:hypothetical protein